MPQERALQMTSPKAVAFAIMAAIGLGAGPGLAQEATFDLELNNLQSVENGCRLTYVAKNGTGADLDAVSYEVAIFDGQGTVSRLLILQFGTLDDGKTKVVQFDLADQSCDNVSRLLVNGVEECSVAAGEAPDCGRALNTSSRTDVVFDR